MRAAGCLCLLACLGAFAQDTPPPVKDLQSEYVVDSWQTDDGLPDNFINEIAQTPDGYLWIATFNGLVRFNGVEFVTFDEANTPQLENSRVTEFTSDRRGRLWIKSETGALTCLQNGKFADFTRKDWKLGGARILRQDAAGTVWLSQFFDTTNLYRLEGDSFEPVASEKRFDERFGVVSDIYGGNWNIFSNCLCRVGGTNPIAVPIPGYVRNGYRLTAGKDGGIWVISNRIRKYREGQWTDFGAVTTDLFNGHIEDIRGQLWVGTDVGELWRVSTNSGLQRFRLPGVATSQLGRGLCEDAEGNLWFGTGGAGLYRLKPRAFQVYDSHDGLASDLVRSVAEDQAGNVFFASVNRVDWLPAKSRAKIQSRGLKITLPWEVLGGRDGSLWVGTFGEGLFRLSTNGVLTQYADKVREDPMNAMFEERSGQIDLGIPSGLRQLKNGKLVNADKPPGVLAMDVRTIGEDASGRLYLGLESGGLLRRSATGWDHFTTNEGLAEDHLRTLWVDSNNTVWIGTQRRGLSRFKQGKFFSFINVPSAGNLKDDLPHAITSIVEDNEGYLWLASTRGLFRAKLEQLNQVADGTAASADIFHYDHSDGMGSSECIDDHQPGAWKAKDGKLWFATLKGVTVVDPATLPFNARPPPVSIEQALVDDRPIWSSSTNAGAILRVPPDSLRLEFRFAALSLTAPQRNRFRFQLEGFDHDWEDAGIRRTAFYKRVPPGNYTFKVIAANNDGVWNNDGASLAVVVVPAWWQTISFRACVGMLVVLVVAGAYLWRVRTLEQQAAAQKEFSRRLIESQERERQRIAAELHDSLGQSLLVMKSRALLALREPDIPAPVAAELDALTDLASGAISEARQIAHNLRPFQLDELGLTRAIRGMINNVSRAAGLKVTHDLADVDGAFARQQEINVYRIVQELLNNVMKHAQAREAKVTIERDATRVRLVVKDNGCGFSSNGNGASGFGMRSVAERVRIMAGQWEVRSTPGQGTTVEVNLPMQMAASVKNGSENHE